MQDVIITQDALWYSRYEHGRTDCRYNRNPGYVVFSAMGSFFLPLLVVLYVYARISCVVATRHDRLGEMRNGENNIQVLIFN